MALAFVFDEHLRGPLWQAILRHNLQGQTLLDVVRVGDAAELPLGVDDADLLLWAEQRQRLLVTEDRHTMAAQLRTHLQKGRHSPGVLMVRRGVRMRDLVESLDLIANAGEPTDFADAITYIP